MGKRRDTSFREDKVQTGQKVPQRDDPEQPMRTEALSEKRRLDLKRMRRRKSNRELLHPWYVGQGDNTCAGGEVVYTIQEIQELLNSQPEDMNQWLTKSQMGWALAREENEVVNEKDEHEGKPVV